MRHGLLFRVGSTRLEFGFYFSQCKCAACCIEAATDCGVACVLPPRLLFADGGIVQFQKQAGPFFVTVFSAPVPLRVGAADLSVMVQKADDRSEVLDAMSRCT